MQNLRSEVESEISRIIDTFFTDLAGKLAKIWINFVKDIEELSTDAKYKRRIFLEVSQQFLDDLKSNPNLLASEHASLIIDPSYEHYCETPLILRFHGPLSLIANIPHTLYIYAIPRIVTMILNRIREEIITQESLVSHNEHARLEVRDDEVALVQRKHKVDARTFIGWLFEAGRALPVELSELDVMILRTVGHIPLFESTSSLNNAQRIMRFLGLKKNTGQFNKRLASMIKKIIWRPKFNVNVAPLGFDTIYLPPIPLMWYEKLKRQYPVLEKSKVFTIWIKSREREKYRVNVELDEWIFEDTNTDGYHLLESDSKSRRDAMYISGIFQLPIYSQILDDLITSYGAISLKDFYITVNLHYLHVGVNEASYPLVIDTDMIFEPTNAIKLNLNPRWDESEKFSESHVKIMQFFSDLGKGLGTYTMLGNELGIHRIFISKMINSLVKRKILYYLPLFMRIGMDSRLILITKTKDSYMTDALVSSLTRAPRSVIFKSPNLAFFYLSLGKRQVAYLLKQLEIIDEEITYFAIPRASFVSDYQYRYSPALHLMKWHRRADGLILFDDFL